MLLPWDWGTATHQHGTGRWRPTTNDIIGTRVDLQSNYFYGRYNPDIQRQISRQNLSDKGSSYYDEQTSSNNLNNSPPAEPECTLPD